MRDIYQVLYRKEQELERVRREIAVLKTVIPLLEEPTDRAPGLTVIPFERAIRTGAQRLPSALRD